MIRRRQSPLSPSSSRHPLAAPASVLCLVALCFALPARGDTSDQGALLRKADAIAAKVAGVRGLPIKRAIERGVMSKDRVRERLVARIDEEYSADEIAAEQLALQRFGLIPPGTDYKKLLIDVLTDQLAGFYDPAERKLYIAGWQQNIVASAGDMLMAHEIDHALQDQHFDLKKFLRPDKRNNDASVARQALVEGDGMALMIEYMMDGLGVKAPWNNQQVLDMMEPQMVAAMAGQLGNVPLVVREGLAFPYVEGLKFVVHFRKRHPWSRVDRVYARPPLSTEHILHPMKYDRYERPDEVEARPLPALAGYRVVYDSVSGEAGLLVLLQQHPGPRLASSGKVDDIREKAADAVAGWGGDRMAVYAPSGHDGALTGTVGVAYTVWDRPADAIEFFDMMSDGLSTLSSGGNQYKGDPGHIEYRDAAGRVFAAQRKNDAVVLVVAAPAAKGRAVLDQVWKRWRVRRR